MFYWEYERYIVYCVRIYYYVFSSANSKTIWTPVWSLWFPSVFCFSWIFDKEDNSSCLFLGLKLPGELPNLFYLLTGFGVEFAALSYLYCVCVFFPFFFLVFDLSQMSVCMLRLYTINSHHNFQLIILLKRLFC